MKWSLSMRYQRLLSALAGTLLGACAAALSFEIWTLFANDGLLPPVIASIEMVVYGSLCGLGALLGAVFAGPIARRLQKSILQLSALMSRAPAGQLLSAIVGLIIGLVLALLGSQLLSNFKPASIFSALSVVLYVVLGSLGATVGAKRYQEWPIEKWVARAKSVTAPGAVACAAPNASIVVDTSALIDGRILGVCRAGFLSGTLLIPADVLTELRHIADHPDAQRRLRGRRGLETLESLKAEPDVRIVVDDTAFADIPEVDARIVRLALKCGARLLTTDYNLQAVASVAGVRVLRLNDLSTALKSPLLPGEEVTLVIQREGKERAQGIGYLSDGTMIVVEDARSLVGSSVCAVVTSALQTSAGRMIFARLK